MEDYESWSVIRKTMMREMADDSEIEARESKEFFDDKLAVSIQTGTMAQQAHLLRAAVRGGVNLSLVTHLFEFGGGLGDMVPIARQLMPNLEKHVIFDIEPVSQIQQHRHGYAYWLETVSTIDALASLIPEPDAYPPSSILFVSVCAISESPTVIRDMLVYPFPHLFRRYALRVQNAWDGINNIDYFYNIPHAAPRYTEQCIFPGHIYLIRGEQ